MVFKTALAIFHRYPMGQINFEVYLYLNESLYFSVLKQEIKFTI